MSEQGIIKERPLKSWSEGSNSAFLSADMLGGKPRTLTIKAASLAVVGGGEGGADEEKKIIRFNETEKAWIVNVTNTQCLRAMFGGDDPQSVVGHRVTLYPVKTQYKGQDADGIRVWGSPELERDQSIEIKLPKKRPQRVTLHAVKMNPNPARPAPREPGADDV